MTFAEKFYYCRCIKKNRYRYNYGRQANRTLKDINLPDRVPDWVHRQDLTHYTDFPSDILLAATHPISTSDWRPFKFKDLFAIRKGKRITKKQMRPGPVPCIRPIAINNGIIGHIDMQPNHAGNVITVSYNGSVGEAFYQPEPIFALDDINILCPKFSLTPYLGIFLVTLIRREKYRFNYGRKWHLERMNESILRLPVDRFGNPDWQFMESYIKSLPFSQDMEA